MKITEEHLKKICRIGQGNKCCRYITVGPKGFACVKHTRVRNNDMVAQGDNCDGYPSKEGN